MKVLTIIGVSLLAAWVVLYLTRDSWGEIVGDWLAERVHTAIHDKTPSHPSWLKDFARRTGAKIIQLEIRAF